MSESRATYANLIETPALYTFGFSTPHKSDDTELILRRARIHVMQTPRGNYVYLVFADGGKTVSIYLGARKKKKDREKKA